MNLRKVAWQDHLNKYETIKSCFDGACYSGTLLDISSMTDSQHTMVTFI